MADTDTHTEQTDESPPVDLTPGGYLSEEERSRLAMAAARLPKDAPPPPMHPAARLLEMKSPGQAVKSVFELIGGVPRMALWADQNPTDFYRLFAKLIPSQITGDGGGPVTFRIMSYADWPDSPAQHALIDAPAAALPEVLPPAPE